MLKLSHPSERSVRRSGDRPRTTENRRRKGQSDQEPCGTHLFSELLFP